MTSTIQLGIQEVQGEIRTMARIVIVEDEVIITIQLEERLKKMGYQVVGRARSGQEAMETARSLNPDLILMDIIMPGNMDGIEAAEKIKRELDIPVIFLTSYADDTLINRAKKAEPFGYILKPYQEYEIKAAIELIEKQGGKVIGISVLNAEKRAETKVLFDKYNLKAIEIQEK